MIKQWYNCGYPVLPYYILHRNILAIIAKKLPPGNKLEDHRGVTISTVQSKTFAMYTYGTTGSTSTSGSTDGRSPSRPDSPREDLGPARSKWYGGCFRSAKSTAL